MNALFATLLLSATVAASVGLGICLAGLALQVFFRIVMHAAKPAEAARPRLSLVTTQAHASGD